METMSESIAALANALAAAQAVLEPAAKNAENPHLKNRYADIAAVFEAIRKVLPKHGLAVAQMILPTEGKAHVRTMLIHQSGEWIAGECVLPPDRAGGPQGMGSAITYARRYSLSALLGLVSEEDDDGERAQGRPPRAQQRAARTASSPAPATSPTSDTGMTKAQSNALMAYLTKRHGQNREAYLAELSDFFGRPITSSRELSRAEVSDFLEAVRNGREAA